MIYRISSSLPTFKNLDFQPGLNILLADKSPDSSDRQTRNRAGKTSLIRIIHFLTGENVDKDSIFKNDALIDHAFSMQFDLRTARVEIERRGKLTSKVEMKLLEGDLPGEFSLISKNFLESYVLTNANWKSILGSTFFNILVNNGEDEDENEEDDEGAKILKNKFKPSIRSLFGYFARRQSEGGFLQPLFHTSKQKLYDQQVSISFLMGLDWSIPQEWEYVREKEKSFKELKNANKKDGLLSQTIGNTADLRTQLALSERRLTSLKETIEQFNVLPEYKQIEKEASELTRKMNQLVDSNTLDTELLKNLENSLRDEAPPPVEDLADLYQEVGVVLPDAAKTRFEDVRKFHETIIRNRALYLKGEVDNARSRIIERDRQLNELSIQYSNAIAILRSHGALDQFVELQSKLARQEAETETLRQRFALAEKMERLETQMKIDRQNLELRLRQDFSEQNSLLQDAIVIFEEISHSLYDDAGSLTINSTLNGPEFGVKIHGAKSKGISNMQIFCFDLMIQEICKKRGIGPGFLVHDSHLFDGVDERQIGRALQVGSAKAREIGFQYIVTLNSDQFPRGYELEPYVLPVKLTDTQITGGLFGLKFN